MSEKALKQSCRLRLLMIGDVVGRPGRQITARAVPLLRIAENVGFVVANAENSAGGSGLTYACYRQFLNAGVDCLTMGDHVFRQGEIFRFIDQTDRVVRPANYPRIAPGKPFTVLRTADQISVAVLCLLGRTFMPPVDCPFEAAERILEALPPDVRCIVVDIHAEATSDKQLIARYLDGRVSAVLGTHTHVPTADEQILPKGTAFQCDVGMTGPHDSILGRRIDRVMETVRTFRPRSFDVATGDVRLNGALVEIDASTGKAVTIRRLCLTSQEVEELAVRLGVETPASSDPADSAED